MRRLRATSGLIMAALLVSACGARLSDDRRQIAIEGALAAPQDALAPASGTGGEGTATTTGTTGSTGTATTGTTSDATAPGASVDTGTTTDTTTTGTAPGSTTTTTGDATTGSDDGSGQATTGTTSQQPTDTRAMPPGGNGGATDVGVTESQIFIANVSDLSGPVPGLFEEAQIATKAAIEWFKATEGTIYGRTPVYRPYDAKMDTSANRSAYQDACATTFVAVGSWSAFDQGAAPVVESCGGDNPYPDLRTVALTPKLQGLENMVSADAMKPYHQTVAHMLWVKQRQPEVIADAAYLFIAGDVTSYNSGMERWAGAQIGFEWDVVEQIEVSESNYAPYVLQMKNAGVKHVQFQGAYQQAVKLAKAMRQQNYWPPSVVFQANVYNRDFLELGGDDIEGVVIPLASYPLEEVQSNPEAKQYTEWYQRVAPGKNPTAMGMYSWAMTKLFFEAAKAAGPQLTRQKVLDHVRAIADYTGNGLFAPQDYATKTPSACTILAVVQDGRFVRQGPAQGYYCEGGVYQVPPDEINNG